MAGIGFVLRKLSKQDNLIGLVQAYTYSAIASTGPWLFTIFALGSIVLLGSKYTSVTELYEFRSIIIYNFAFSLVFSAPVFMVTTRFLADAIYNKDVSGVPGMFIGSLALLYATQLPLALGFYLLYANLDTAMALSAIMNFMLITGIWLASVFLTALKDYKAVTRSFAIGLFIAIISTVFLAKPYGAVGILNGFSIGLSYIMGSLIASVFIEYPYKFKNPFAFMPYFKKYWEIALGGLVYNMAVWVDKWIMWFSPEAERHSSNLILYPNYDSAMFLAYLTIVPSMAFFVFNIETSFYENYLRFYRDISKGATFQKIQKNHMKVLKNILESSRNFLILQAAISISVILMAPKIFNLLGINYLQMGVFRYGVLGALFHIMTMLLTILLSYFDNRMATLKIHFLFLISNIVFTYTAMNMGFEYYGYGYFLASVLTFVVAAFVTINYVSRLPYHTFITSNTSV